MMLLLVSTIFPGGVNFVVNVHYNVGRTLNNTILLNTSFLDSCFACLGSGFLPFYIMHGVVSM